MRTRSGCASDLTMRWSMTCSGVALPFPSGRSRAADRSTRRRLEGRAAEHRSEFPANAQEIHKVAQCLPLCDYESPNEEVRAEGLEPPRLAPPAPKAGVSTGSTTPARDRTSVARTAAGLYVPAHGRTARRRARG